MRIILMSKKLDDKVKRDHKEFRKARKNSRGKKWVTL